MAKDPPIPPEQRAFTAGWARDRLRSAQPARRDEPDGPRSSRPGGGDVNLKQQGSQDSHNQGCRQDR